MTSLFKSLAAPSSYRDQKYQGTSEEFANQLSSSTTLYIGNLSFYTTEEQIYELFVKCGEIKRIIMGLHREEKTPCGFCFVEYYHREAALDCMKYINSTKLDQRVIRCDIDPGFKEGRQFGRGKSGGQVRDEYRTDYDADRGGVGYQMRYAAQSQAPTGGSQYQSREYTSTKRKRDGDDEDDDPQRTKKYNPRFREDDNEDED